MSLEMKTALNCYSKRITFVWITPLFLLGFLLFTDTRDLIFNRHVIPRPAILRTTPLPEPHIQGAHNIRKLAKQHLKSNARLSSTNTSSTDRTAQFFIYTVVAEQSFTDLSWKSLIFNGWEEQSAATVNYRCCFKYNDSSVRSVITSEKRTSFLKRGALLAKQIVCNLNGTKPDLAGLVLENQTCDDLENSDCGYSCREPVRNRTNCSSKCREQVYILPVYRRRQRATKFAICAKIAYGGKRANELVEWMEYHLHYGVSRVLIYPYEDLNQDAYRVLEYYAKQGFVEMVPLSKVPLLDKYERKFHLASYIKDQDEQVPTFDAQERLRPYTYYALVDTDEFIAPGHDNITNFVQLMDFLLQKHDNAATFRLYTEIHLLNWEQTDNTSQLTMAQFGHHTEPTKITRKHIHVTERIEPGSVWIHDAKPTPGFVRVEPDASDVVLKHYRDCKPRWFRAWKASERKPVCRDNFQKIRGHFMDKVAKKIKANIYKVKKLLGFI